jgi:hypothetical protein
MTVLPAVSLAAWQAAGHGAFIAIRHARHIGTGAAVGGVILLAAIAGAGILIRRWHAGRNRPPEP